MFFFDILFLSTHIGVYFVYCWLWDGRDSSMLRYMDMDVCVCVCVCVCVGGGGGWVLHLTAERGPHEPRRAPPPPAHQQSARTLPDTRASAQRREKLDWQFSLLSPLTIDSVNFVVDT